MEKFCKAMSWLFGKLEFQVFIVWITICLPANIVTGLYYMQSLDENNSTSVIEDHPKENLTCHQLKEDWEEIIEWSKILIQVRHKI